MKKKILKILALVLALALMLGGIGGRRRRGQQWIR